MIRVVSVYIDSPLSDLWISLQSKFLQDTTPDYEFVVLANGTSPEPFRRFAHRVEHSPSGVYHLDGLKHLLSLPWDGTTLILDSDCFPISDWSILFDRLKTCDFIAPIRFENLENYPHPCMALSKPGIKLDPEYRTMPMIDTTTTKDVGFDPKLICNALVRTNRINFHPLLGAVYEFFYHHGCGSRTLLFKSMRRWKIDHEKSHNMMIDRLRNNPREYVAEIAFKQDRCRLV